MKNVRYSVDPSELSGISKKHQVETEEWHISESIAVSRYDNSYRISEQNGASETIRKFTPNSYLLHTERLVSEIEINGRRFELHEYSTPWKCSFIVPFSSDGLDTSKCIPNDMRFFRNRRIGLFGAACSGKSVAARTISNFFNVNMHIPTDTPYEAATEWIQLHGIPDFKAQVSIFHRQKQLEEGILKSGKVAVIDSPFPLTFIYARFYTATDNRRHPLYFKMLEESARGMDDYGDQIYLPPREWVDDGVRYRKNGSDEERKALDDMLTSWMREHGTNVLWHEDEIKPPAIGRRFLRILPIEDIFV